MRRKNERTRGKIVDCQLRNQDLLQYLDVDDEPYAEKTWDDRRRQQIARGQAAQLHH
jgi:hypothetical protein